MYERKCPNCGGDKIFFENGHFKCAFCDAVFAGEHSHLLLLLDKPTLQYNINIPDGKQSTWTDT